MKQSLTEQVGDRLKIDILSGKYASGDHLPTVRKMTELFHVSRSVINAVVVDLESNGYIKIVPTKWIEVAEWETEGNLSILSDLFTLGLFDRSQLDSLLEARRLLEFECVKKACQSATGEALAQLEALIAKEESETDPGKRAALDLQFHYAICKMSGNMVYGIIMKEFEKSASPLIALFYHDPTVLPFTVQKHQCIAEAIRTHDTAAAETQMRLLLEHGEIIIKKLLQRRFDYGSQV